MKSGPRDDLITIERKSVTTDDYGGEVETWATYATEWAQVIYGSGKEQREAAQLQGSLPATFEVLANPLTLAVTELDRINFDGTTWNIVAPPARLGRDGVRLQAVKG
ncbi:MAG: head-tail adaptor protein [Sphingomonadales bacterium]|nr:MAG: head-tail adaptor protein [Sphingomonadales bacterium]